MSELDVQVANAIEAKLEELTTSVVERDFPDHPAHYSRFGSDGGKHDLEDTRYHLQYLAQAVRYGSHRLFLEYVEWLRSRLGSMGVGPEVVSGNLQNVNAAILDLLGPQVAERVRPFINGGVELLSGPASGEGSYVKPGAPLADMAQDYLSLLLKGDRREASRLVVGAIESGTPLRDVYIHVFETTQREVGRLWQTNQISLAQEHFCTAATQAVMAQLYPRVFKTEKVGLKAVATCVSGELHELGIRLVSDFLEMDGWTTYYLGADMPMHAVVSEAIERQADVLAISATMSFYLEKVEKLIKAVRSSEGGGGIRIMVGGYPFNLDPDLWLKLGADATAINAEQAATGARLLVGKL